jgi:outer membrane lipoprotein SlyB
MKKSIILFMVFSFLSVQLSGCASYNRQFANRADMGMFSGCISGMIAGGIVLNLPGAGMGCILGTGAGYFIGERIDKKLGTRREALMKYKVKDNEEKLYVEEHTIAPQNAPMSATIKTSVQYTIIAADEGRKITVTEKRTLFNEKTGFVQLDERRVLRTQGTYESTYTFVVPENVSRGDCQIITTISDDTQTKTIVSHFTVV